MNLSDKSLEERKKLTKSYPILIAAFPNAGKSSAVEMLSDEDKARTIIYDLEGKGLPEDDESLYRAIIKIKNVYETNDYLYKDVGNVKYKSIEDVMVHMRKAMAHKDVDRIIIDSFSTLVDEFEKHYVTVSNGFASWIQYNKELYSWFRMLKEETYTHGKFVYVMAHYKPAKDPKDTESEKFTTVKGKDHFRMVESHFNTVLSIEDFKFRADNTDTFDSTRIKRSLSPYESKQNSLAELEETITK
jgi:hypothetical protein